MKKICLLKWTRYFLIILMGGIVATFTHNEIIGDLVSLGLFVLYYFCAQLQQQTEALAHDLLARRMAARLANVLESTLSTPHFSILHIEEWPMSKLAEWPETPQNPAPLRAWDVTVQAHDGSGPENLTIYVDAQLYTLPAVSPDDQLQGQYD